MVVFDPDFALLVSFCQSRLEREQLILSVSLVVDMTALVSLHTSAGLQVAESISDSESGTLGANTGRPHFKVRREGRCQMQNIHVMRDGSLRRHLAAIVPQSDTPSFQIEARFHDTAMDTTLPSRPP